MTDIPVDPTEPSAAPDAGPAPAGSDDATRGPAGRAPGSQPRPGTSRARRRRQRRRRTFAVLGALLVVVVVVVLGGLWWVHSQVDPGGKAGPTVKVVVPKGASTADIGALLHQKGVIPNGSVFHYWVSYRGKGPFEAGRYVLPTNISDDRAIAILSKGPPPLQFVTVSIPEGFTIKQIVARLHQRVPRFSEAAIRAELAARRVPSPFLPAGSADYEGLLYPATYSVVEDQSAHRTLTAMADRLDQEATAVDLRSGAAQLHLTPYQVITVASLVQAEAGNPDEAPKIARVIYNRLAQGMPLGIDATSRYLSSITGQPVDFESTSAYNTRRQTGLPPTPITAPGEFALNAALHPATGPWLYYVRDVHNDAKGRPQHVFAVTDADFERAKQACHDAGLGCG
jgi:UPF0755 protein